MSTLLQLSHHEHIMSAKFLYQSPRSYSTVVEHQLFIIRGILQCPTRSPHRKQPWNFSTISALRACRQVKVNQPILDIISGSTQALFWLYLVSGIVSAHVGGYDSLQELFWGHSWEPRSQLGYTKGEEAAWTLASFPRLHRG
jgi:hypothetical protein